MVFHILRPLNACASSNQCVLTLSGFKGMMNKSPRTLMKDLSRLAAAMMLKRAMLSTDERLTSSLATGPRAILVQSYDSWPALPWLLLHTTPHYPLAAPQHIYRSTESTGHVSSAQVSGHYWEARALWNLIRIKLTIIAGRGADYIACPKQQDRARFFT